VLCSPPPGLCRRLRKQDALDRHGSGREVGDIRQFEVGSRKTNSLMKGGSYSRRSRRASDRAQCPRSRSASRRGLAYCVSGVPAVVGKRIASSKSWIGDPAGHGAIPCGGCRSCSRAFRDKTFKDAGQVKLLPLRVGEVETNSSVTSASTRQGTVALASRPRKRFRILYSGWSRRGYFRAAQGRRRR